MEKLSFKLEVYEGPLDLLLTLINKNKINIYDIPVSLILTQYLEYIDSLKQMDLEVESEFLIMASNLLYIKSRMLLPKYEDEEEEDPRDELVKSLLEYQRYKETAASFSELYKNGVNRYTKQPDITEADNTYMRTHLASELYEAYITALKRVKRRLPPPVTSFTGIVGHAIVSVASRAVNILRKLLQFRKLSYKSVFKDSNSRSEVVATFLAVLELSKNKRIFINEEQNGEVSIYLTKAGDNNGYKKT